MSTVLNGRALTANTVTPCVGSVGSPGVKAVLVTRCPPPKRETHGERAKHVLLKNPKGSHPPEAEKCIQSLRVFQLPPQAQPISANEVTTMSPASIMPGRMSERSV